MFDEQCESPDTYTIRVNTALCLVASLSDECRRKQRNCWQVTDRRGTALSVSIVNMNRRGDLSKAAEINTFVLTMNHATTCTGEEGVARGDLSPDTAALPQPPLSARYHNVMSSVMVLEMNL